MEKKLPTPINETQEYLAAIFEEVRAIRAALEKIAKTERKQLELAKKR